MNAESQQQVSDQNTWIDDLRNLRRKAREAYRNAKNDLEAFQHVDDGTFSTLPPPKGEKIHITTTCTALMALVAARKIKALCPPGHQKKALKDVFERVVKYEWKSEGLQPDNAFSVALVLRAAGFLVKHNYLTRDTVFGFNHENRAIQTIAKDLAEKAYKDGVGQAFSVRVPQPTASQPAAPQTGATQPLDEKNLGTPVSISQSYPPKAAIVYWYIDGIHALKIPLHDEEWKALIRWSTTEFAQQLTRVATADDALMDPVSLAMAACLVVRIKKVMDERDSSDDLTLVLPSKTEIGQAVSLVFDHQRPSGIWPKYFPMFHFQNAGANYCFTFEMLEALISEIGSSDILRLPKIVDKLNRAVDWCKLNRLRYKVNGLDYFGWNSGGSLNTLLASKPESWATATVHWFLHKLDDALSEAIHRALLEKYKVVVPAKADREDWDMLADANVEIQGQRVTVKKVLEEEFFGQLTGVLQDDIRCTVPDRKSVLLFGPPGTAKTTVVRRLAKAVGWPCVEIRPSNFLQRGLDNIYVVADEIFEDLLDLSRTIIFFDEMDALVQSRTMPLDATRQFLTTCMLPKLAELHDEARSAFFVATNYRATFDEAITRPGRFDLLLFVGPPSWTEKLTKFENMVTSSPAGKKIVGSDDDRARALASELKKVLEQWAKDAVLIEELDRFTYDETKTLLEELLRTSGLTTASADVAKAVQNIDKTTFVSLVQNWSEKYIILREVPTSSEKPNDNYTNFVADQSMSRRQ